MVEPTKPQKKQEEVQDELAVAMGGGIDGESDMFARDLAQSLDADQKPLDPSKSAKLEPDTEEKKTVTGARGKNTAKQEVGQDTININLNSAPDFKPKEEKPKTASAVNDDDDEFAEDEVEVPEALVPSVDEEVKVSP